MGLDQSFMRVTDDTSDPPATEEVAYFRKVNLLHRWVEVNLNGGASTNCDLIPISLEALAGLEKTCNEVLAAPGCGPYLLPTQAGFFFGGTEYDEYYLADVREVRDACHRILSHEASTNPPGSGQYAYYSWW